MSVFKPLLSPATKYEEHNTCTGVKYVCKTSKNLLLNGAVVFICLHMGLLTESNILVHECPDSSKMYLLFTNLSRF